MIGQIRAKAGECSTMSVFKIKTGKTRTLPWRAVVSRKGQKPLVSHFANRLEAQMWEAEQRKAFRLRDVPEYRQAQELQSLRSYSVRDLVLDHIRLNPALGTNDILALHQFARETVAAKSVLDFTRQDVFQWVERKQNATWKPPGSNGEGKRLSPRTIRRQANAIQRLFQYAIEAREGFSSLVNPFRGIRIVGSTGGRRERSLEGNELDRILEACKSCHQPNNFFVPLAIYLAIDTGLRRQEIFNLTWNDIDDTNRRIMIRKSKTDKVMGNTNGTTIVLPLKAKRMLQMVSRSHYRGNSQRIFPMTEKAFTQAWADVLKRADITNLHFHDLRREAATRFVNAGLIEEERKLMLRHADKSMSAVYIGRNHLLNKIQDKLDRHTLGGMTLAEAYAKNEPVGTFYMGEKVADSTKMMDHLLKI
jgi:integrase